MFTQLRIRNFKAWQDTGHIRLAPLTVFFGTNSSGKSSLLQFLLMLKQTVQSTDRRRVLHLGDRHSLVDLGGWRDVVFLHEEQRTLGFQLQLQQGRPEECTGWSQDFEAEIAKQDTDQAQVLVHRFSYRSGGRDLGMRYLGEGRYVLWGTEVAAGSTSQEPLPAPSRFYGFPREALALGDSIHELGSEWMLNLEVLLGSIHYLGPLRSSPARSYIWPGTAPEDVGARGDQSVGALLAARKRRFELVTTNEVVGFEGLIARWLLMLGLLEAFEVRSIPYRHEEHEIIGRVPQMPEPVNIVDMGFGVSQTLPVLVQLLYPEQESTLLFEQPELHLHPKAQSELADVFIEALSIRDKDEPRNIQQQYLVETHSEHFLHRIQRRIAEQRLPPEQVALYFCRPGPEGSTIEELKLDEYGNITNWPEDFFGDEVGDLAAMAEAAMKRQLAKKEGR